MNSRVDIAVVTLLLGTVFAGAGWLVTHFVENIVSVPTIEYDVEHDAILKPAIRDHCSANSNSVITIQNLSRTKKFSNLKFILRLRARTGEENESSGKFTYAVMEAIPPAYSPGEDIERNDFDVSSPHMGIHPGTAFKLIACYSADEKPTFHIAEDSEAVLPVARGPLTWLIRNEITVLLVLLVFWIATAALVLAYNAFGERRERP